jgi:hypothetical protein
MIVGRPLRFLGFIVGGWIALRMTILWWPTSERPIRLTQAKAKAGALPAPARDIKAFQRLRIPPAVTTGKVARAVLSPPFIHRPMHVPVADSHAVPISVLAQNASIIAGLPMPARIRDGRSPSRFGGSFWLMARGGDGSSADILGAQLGGSQAGVRLTYALGQTRRLAIAARIAAPLGAGMREVAIGLDWKPSRLPVHVIVEQRIPLNRGRGGATLGLVGGFGPKPIAHHVVLEGYAQAGIIARDGGEGFADGAVRVAHPVAKLGDIHFDLGAGAWGAAQRGAARFDIGPSLVAHIPLRNRQVRVSVDGRHRVAGNAVPDSGLVLTVGADF